MIILVIGAYSFLIFFFNIGLIRLPKTKIDRSLTQRKFSIIIPFRNEENSLNALLKSIQKLNYNIHHFEVLFIDDESSDNSVNIIKDWQLKIPNIQLHNNKRHSNSPKKDAIQVGVKVSNFDFIITSDADCTFPIDWLHAFNSTLHKKNSLFIAGPIALNTKNTFVEQYQKYDNLSLTGVTIGAFGMKTPIMCNAANMGFDKKAYLNIKPSNDVITSGDDIFTLENFVKTHPKSVHYLNTPKALVTTKAETTWKNVIQQRIRWAAKSTHYKNLFTKLVGMIVLLTQLTILIYLFINTIQAILLWVIKLIIDFILIWNSAKKTNQPINLWYYISMAIIYPFLNTYIGIKSLFGGYVWKERMFKR